MNEEKDEDFTIDAEGGADESVVSEEHQAEALKNTKEKLKLAEAKAKEYLDGWQRERADIANARKREEEAKQEFTKFANETLIIEILPVLDSFDMATSHGNRDLEPVRKQLLSILEVHGLKVLDPKIGEDFDPRQHESVGVIETAEKNEDHKVLEVVQKGYILSKEIIRPAKVKIGEYNG